MKKYKINRKNLIKQEYNLLETEKIENDKNNKSIDGELENFLFELYKITKIRKVKSYENISHFIMDTSNVTMANKKIRCV